MPSKPARYWILTIPENDWQRPDELPSGVAHVRGQLEQGGSTGFRHWQLVVGLLKPQRLSWLKSTFGSTAHAETTRSAAADDYVWKEDTAVAGTRFELGSKPFRRNDARDWDDIWLAAIDGDFSRVPADVRVRNYAQLRAIRADHGKASAMERVVSVFWGDSGTGKTRRAWEEAGTEAYPKNPASKFWCGYGGEEHVVIDEFCGEVNISHFLRWLDRYPVLVEIKGSSVPLKAKKIWITSNLSPDEWFPNATAEQRVGIKRRLHNVIHFRRDVQ